MPKIHTQSSFPTGRDQILAILAASGDWCSGEDISVRMGISRAAVAKHVAKLRAEGHAIAAVTRRGYKLLAERDALDGQSMEAMLRTRVIGKNGWLVLEEVASTNLEGMRRASEGAAEGYVIVAERQTCGRGRKGRNWVSLPRGLQFSVILRPETAGWNSEILTSLGVLAVARVLRAHTDLEVRCKAPNDVLVGDRKIAGILVETGMRGPDLEWAVIGIGCNVNALPEDFPEESRGQFTSVLVETDRVLPRTNLLVSILEELERLYDQMCRGTIKNGNFDEIIAGAQNSNR